MSNTAPAARQERGRRITSAAMNIRHSPGISRIPACSNTCEPVSPSSFIKLVLTPFCRPVPKLNRKMAAASRIRFLLHMLLLATAAILRDRSSIPGFSPDNVVMICRILA